MKANYHTHTTRCNHAVGSEEEYVQAAIKRGLHTLGFSDHTPYYFPGDYYSNFRMRMEQLDDYISTVQKLSEQYSGTISIVTGLEAEFYPALFPALMERLRDSEISYLILGQHMIDNEIGAHYSGHPTDDVQVLKKYCHQVCDAFQTGLFTYLAHPDLIHFVGPKDIYEESMRLICLEAKKCSIPLEYNLLGLATNRQYPNDSFWTLAAEEGNQVVLGCDAHKPEALLDAAAEEEAIRRLNKLAISPVELSALRSIR